MVARFWLLLMVIAFKPPDAYVDSCTVDLIMNLVPDLLRLTTHVGARDLNIICNLDSSFTEHLANHDPHIFGGTMAVKLKLPNLLYYLG